MIHTTPYHKWLWQASEKNLASLSHLIWNDVVNQQNPQAFDLIAVTGDKEYTDATFDKAAQIILDMFVRKPLSEGDEWFKNNLLAIIDTEVKLIEKGAAEKIDRLGIAKWIYDHA